jgi:hypothetical protein
VNCEHARLLIGAEPHNSSAELAAHLAGCPECARFREQTLALDERIGRALQHPPVAPAAPVPRRAAPRSWRQWALAASVLLACAATLGVWLLRPSDTLAHELVAHVQGEPGSWLADEHVTSEAINKELRSAGVQLDVTSDKISYAHSCWFRGHYVPHLVVQTAQGPATLLVLHHVAAPAGRQTTFSEDGMSGVIIPAQKGSIALLTRGGDVQQLEQEMSRDLHWMPAAQ